jgi:hypothetical protein
MWLDAGTAYSFTNPLSGSNPNERWAASSGTSGTISQGTLSPKFYHQYLVTPSYGLRGGGFVVSPTLSYVAFGSSNSVTLSEVAPQSLWIDAGSRYATINPLSGSTASERWVTQNQNGSASSPGQLSFTYYHQYAQSLNYSVTGGGFPQAPTLASVQFGRQTSASLAFQTRVFWLDSSSSWSLSNPLERSSSSERWITDATVNGTASRSSSTGLSYLHQFYVTLEISPAAGGSITPLSGWQNAGATLPLLAVPSKGWGFQNWKGTGADSYSGPKSSINVLLRGSIAEKATFYSGILVNATDGGTVFYQYGSNSGVIQEGTIANLLVPLGTNLSLRAASTSPFTKFDSWSGDATSQATQIVVMVNAPVAISALFVYDYLNMVLIGAASIVLVAGGGTVLTRRRKRRR